MTAYLPITAQYATSPPEARYKELDGLRGIAILLVILMHCRQIATPESVLQSVYYLLPDLGWIGVDLFFVLSGFLITRILLNTCQSPSYFSNFYARRALRIFPLFYGFLLLVFVVSRLTNIAAFSQASSWAEASYWLQLQNFLPALDVDQTQILVVFWSLAIEEQFYLVWPMLILIAARRGEVERLCIAVLIGCVVFRAGYIYLGYEGAYQFTLSRLDGLVMGAYLAAMLKRMGSFDSLHNTAAMLAAISALAIILIRAAQGGFYPDNSLVLQAGLPLLAALFSCLLVLAHTAPRDGKYRRMLRNNLLCQIGIISFGMYVFHMGVIIFIKHLEIMPINFWLAQIIFPITVTAITGVIARLSFKYFEGHFLSQKSRLS